MILGSRQISSFLWCQIERCYIPDEVFGTHDCGGHCVAEGLELDEFVLLEELLAKEDVEVLVPLVGHVDDVGVLSGSLSLDFHF